MYKGHEHVTVKHEDVEYKGRIIRQHSIYHYMVAYIVDNDIMLDLFHIDNIARRQS